MRYLNHRSLCEFQSIPYLLSSGKLKTHKNWSEVTFDHYENIENTNSVGQQYNQLSEPFESLQVGYVHTYKLFLTC